MTFIETVLFFLVPAIGAAINSVAGGGTFLTFPVFIMSGLTPLQANVMSTVALWPGTISSGYAYNSTNSLSLWERVRVRAATSFKPQTLSLKHPPPQPSPSRGEGAATPLLFLICIIGGAAGSLTLLNTPEQLFSWLVPWLLLVASLIFTFGKYGVAWLHSRFPASKEHRGIAAFIQLFIAFYGGYFGAGIGILMLAMLQLMGMRDIHQMNALKVLLAAFINAATVLIFALSGAVIWNLAAIMVAGGVVGGFVGARLALKISPAHIRILVSLIGFSMSAYFFMKG